MRNFKGIFNFFVCFSLLLLFLYSLLNKFEVFKCPLCKTKLVIFCTIRTLYLNNGFEGEGYDNRVNIKTVYRDIEALRSYCGLDIQYDQKKKAYFLRNPPFEDRELRLIVDSINASKFITQQKASILIRKIQEHFGTARKYTLNRQAYVYDRIQSQNDSVVYDADRLYDAIAAKSKTSFKYFHHRPDMSKDYYNNGDKLTVSPYALYWNGGNLYLYAYDGEKFHYYRVDRMESISKPTSKEREGEDLYNEKVLTSQKAKVFQNFAGTPYNVKMRFRNNLTDQVIDQFGRGLVLIPDGDGHFTFTAPVEVSPTFYAWIATYGEEAQIISPPEAVEGMKDFLQKAMKMYKNDGNT